MCALASVRHSCIQTDSVHILIRVLTCKYEHNIQAGLLAVVAYRGGITLTQPAQIATWVSYPCVWREGKKTLPP